MTDRGEEREGIVTDKKATVLLIEDDQIQRQLMIRRLDKMGFRTVEASNGAEACEVIEKAEIDVAIVDWELPDIKGPDIIAKYCDNEQLMIPFIMLTAYNDPEKISFALDKGAFDFLKKPANKVELEARLRSAIKFRNLQQKYLELAIRDPLTGLYNRRYLERQMVFTLANLADEDLSVALIDIDYFKKVNDTHGHDVGDVVLKQMAHLLSANLRVFDYVCRIGGEEFVVVLPQTKKSDAQFVLNRILEQARARSWGNRDNSFKVTFSCGVTTAQEGECNIDKMLKIADGRLYYAKENGRNQVMVENECTIKNVS